MLIAISPDTETFQPKLDEFAEKITARTKAVIVKSENASITDSYAAERLKYYLDEIINKTNRSKKQREQKKQKSSFLSYEY